MPQAPTQFENVTVLCKANVYFDGRVISHTVMKDGKKISVGVILPGAYKFNTVSAEQMLVTTGSCRAKVAGQSSWTTYAPGESFRVAKNSSFDVAVDQMCEYVCTFE